MSIQPSRRLVLLGAAGTGLLAAGCKTGPVPKQAEDLKQTEDLAAFPGLPAGHDFLGPQKGVARLHSNENPYGPAKSALKMVDYAARKGAYYADGQLLILKKLIAERHGLAPENIAISAGSAEALSAVSLVFGQKGPIVAPRLFFDPTVMYAKRLGLAEVERVPLANDMGIDLAGLESRVNSGTGLVHICNPNNPTGMMLDITRLKPAVRRMAQQAPVVVDEAYMELTDNPDANSCIDLIRAGHNVIVARTFSKIYGMAGLRVGYLLARPDMISQIEPAIMSWITGTGLAAAVGCYNDEAFLSASRAKILQARQMIVDATTRLGLETLPSQTNFVYFKSGKSANDVRKAFADRQIHIRGQYMDYTDWTRVSTGRLEDVDRFCKTLPMIIA